MRLRQLEYAIAVAEEASFTEAARTVRVSQPALSHQVKALEEELGNALFERLPGEVLATGHGSRFLPHARAAAAAARAAAEA
ncbi:LysR family transcriptional regulator, partial [Actinocorallia libanotica]|uniref:LysR family transcriptional regulator n=1 Tax=Actinocorallia libanotica TaxID=46162 RepID=UPI0031E17B9E